MIDALPIGKSRGGLSGHKSHEEYSLKGPSMAAFGHLKLQYQQYQEKDHDHDPMHIAR